MLRRILLAVSLLSLLGPMGCTVTQAKDDSVAHMPAPKKKSSEMANSQLLALLPRDHTSPTAGDATEFNWTKPAAATHYRLEIEEAYAHTALKTVRLSNVGSYRMPSAQLQSSKDLRWRVVALDQTGKVVAQTAWRILLSPSSECEN